MNRLKILFSNKEFLMIIFLILFSILFNQYYGSRGVFPHDSFSHFETGYRILLGEFPFKDYWVVSGPFIDYLQGLFFLILGTNWQSYVFHASVINCLVTVATFILLRNFNLNIFYSFIYSIFFSILAYPSSGTPFVDHHSTFFSLLGIYALILGIKNNKKHYWIFFPIFFIFAFLSKQVPASYIILFILPISIFYLIRKKKYHFIKITFLSGVLISLILIIIGYISGIDLLSFMEQYIFYPPSIGESRIENLKISLPGFLNHFKFIFIALFPLVYINLKRLFSRSGYSNNNDFYYFLIIFIFSACLIFHQVLTKNQTFIFFLVPLITAFSHIYIGKVKNLFNYFIIIFCLFVTLKYHLRFNEGRKFHELTGVDFKLAIKAEKIDAKLKGLKWISPQYKNPKTEVVLLNQIKKILKNDRRNIMVLGNYPFLSVILEKNFSSTTRWHTFDGTDYPQIGNKYYSSYKDLFIKVLKEKKIKVIYSITPIKNSNIYNYISKDCFEETKINENVKSYELKFCNDLNFF
ncbi:MAG: glycosyltransferase family 39 protein [Pelagibacteraceae bacterium]|tara:strand:- start:29593 stop:31158 length:1566 start_codon:yes stop_codon:yes gene_type:complete